MRRPSSSAVALVALLCASAAGAQIFSAAPVARSSRGPWGLHVALDVAQPVGDFADNVNNAIGIGTSLRRFVAGPLAIRGDFGMLTYGNERQRVPLSGTVNRVTVAMTTSNNILVLSAGPELAVRRGPFRPYAHGFVGWSYFFTESSVGDDDGGGAFARSTNFDDGGLAAGGGAGVRVPFNTRRADISLDAGARYTRNGVRSYLRRGDIIDNPDGSLSFTPRVTEADFWVYYVGMSLGFGRR